MDRQRVTEVIAALATAVRLDKNMVLDIAYRLTCDPQLDLIAAIFEEGPG